MNQGAVIDTSHPLFDYIPLHLVAKNSTLEALKYLVKEKGGDINVVNYDFQTLVHCAAQNSNLEVLKYLVEEKGADINVANNYGDIVLHYLCC